MTKKNRPRILIVDDIPANVQVLGDLLADDYELFFALNGYDAITLTKAHRPDIILLDVMMPDIDGFEVCRKMRDDTLMAEIPVIFITALEHEDDELKGLELGAVDYIIKPVNSSLVKLRIRNQLELKRQRDVLKERAFELERALERVKKLEGIIPICMYCKKIRDDEDSWHQLEKYITEHTEAFFSHGICPECYERAEAEFLAVDMKK